MNTAKIKLRKVMQEFICGDCEDPNKPVVLALDVGINTYVQVFTYCKDCAYEMILADLKAFQGVPIGPE